MSSRYYYTHWTDLPMWRLVGALLLISMFLWGATFHDAITNREAPDCGNMGCNFKDCLAEIGLRAIDYNSVAGVERGKLQIEACKMAYGITYQEVKNEL
jgi:hypothetical protein